MDTWLIFLCLMCAENVPGNIPVGHTSQDKAGGLDNYVCCCLWSKSIDSAMFDLKIGLYHIYFVNKVVKMFHNIIIRVIVVCFASKCLSCIFQMFVQSILRLTWQL